MQLVKFKISASIGVTIYPHDQADVDILIRHADQAMYEAKDRGKSEICYFDINRSRSIETRKKLLKDIQHALTNNQFEIFYQPRIRLSDGKLAGAEALLRWETPQGQIPPSEIVAALRNSYGEWELDNWVIEKVLSDIKHFKEKRLDGPYSINVNPSSIENPTFPDVLNTVLRKWNIAGEDIEIEILEIESIKNFDLARNILNQCKALGVNFSLDDFGTGYSSLTYFHALPISKVKIDQRFIKSAHADPDSLLLVRSILAVANANNKPVIAEGIETETIAKTLTELDCGYGQGFGIAIPMPMHDYINWALSTASDSSTPKKLM